MSISSRSPRACFPLGLRQSAIALLFSSSLVLCACSSGHGGSDESSAPSAHKEVAAASSGDDSVAAESSATTKAKGAVEVVLNPYDVSTEEKASALAKAQDLMWLQPFTPYTGSESQVYGSPSNGCIAGALGLSDKEESFQIQRWGSDRHYAHPLMLQYLQDLRARAASLDLPPLLIGDLSRKYGGPYGSSSSHASHNTGLDVDLPFDFAEPRKSQYELEHPKDNYIVTGQKVRSSFTPEIASYIKLAASDPRVDRVFVAPMIKKHMCALYEGKDDSGFLHKLRPWFGHRAHMHVRLNCPSDSPNCVIPTPIPEGSGCGYEVESWFLPPPPKTQSANSTPKKPKAKKVLPPQCPLILQQYLRQ